MFGLFQNKARENATKFLRLMVLFRQVQGGVDLETLHAIASKRGITIINQFDPSADRSVIPNFPHVLVIVFPELDTPDVSQLHLVGVGPLEGLSLIMMAGTESITITVDSRRWTHLAMKISEQLRRVCDRPQPSLTGGFSAEFGLNEIAASEGEPQTI